MIIYKFHKLMKESEKSLREVAKQIGVSHVTLARLMNARTLEDYNLGADVMNKICRYFKCKLTDVVEFKKG